MERKQFEELVEKAIESIPEAFSHYLVNVVFLVELFPDEDILSEIGMEFPEDLLGLYQGDPLTERGADSWGMLPDQIILFQRPIELYAKDFGEPVVNVIRDTILHEVGHFFGLSEDDLIRMGLE